MDVTPRSVVAVDHRPGDESTPTPRGSWTGRVLTAGAVPLAGVAIRIGEVGVPIDEPARDDAAVTSGPDGRFEVSVSAPVEGAGHVLVLVDREHGVVGVPVDGAADLGDLRLPRAGSVVGRLVGVEAAGLAVRCDPVGQPGELAVPLRSVVRRVPVRVDGSFVVERLAPGHYALSPEAPGDALHAARCHVEVLAGDRVDVGELLCVGSRDLVGRVTDGVDHPVEGAAVQLRAPALAGWPPRHLRTGGDGAFTFERVPDVARLWLRVEAEGYRSTELSGEELLGPSPIRVRLDAGLTIAGLVVDAADGAPVTRFQAVAVRVAAPSATSSRGPAALGGPAAPGGPLQQRPEEHPEGRFEVTGLEAGWYEVHALAPGYVRGRSVAVELGRARRPEVRIAVERGLRYAGVLVLEPGGRVLGGARLRLTRRQPGDGPLQHGHALSADDGRFVVDGLRPGTYDVAIFHRDLGEEHRDELLLVESLEDQRVALPAPAWLTGTVAGLRAGESSHATVRAVGGGGRTRSSEVDAAGRYRLGPLPAGNYAVRAFTVPFAVHRLAEPGLAADARPADLPVDCVLGAGEERRLDLSVTRYPVGALEGVVRVNGEPAAGVLVGVPTASLQARTDAQGHYRLDDLLAGRIELRVELSGGRDRAFLVEQELVAGASPTRRDFDLGLGVLRGRLVGEGWPPGGVNAVWEVDRDAVGRRWNPVQINIEGDRFEVEVVPSGPGRLVVPVHRERPVVREAVVPPGIGGVDLEVRRD